MLAQYRCSLQLQTEWHGLYVCPSVCVGHMMSHSKMAELMKMPLGGRLVQAQHTMY